MGEKLREKTIDQIKTNQLLRLPFDIWIFTHTRQGHRRYSGRYAQNQTVRLPKIRWRQNKEIF